MRQNFGRNHDTYVAEILGRHQAQQVIKLVDRFAAYDDPIRLSLLEANTLKCDLSARRNCDSEAISIHLSAMKEQIFDEDLRAKLSEGDHGNIPCFVVEHRSTRITGH